MKALGWVSAIAVFSVLGWAQAVSTSQIRGTVQDSTGASVPDAQVKVTQTDTGLTRATTSGADGGYVLQELPVGPYRMEVTRQGFSTYVQTGIVLQVASNPTIDVALKVGVVSEQVQVEANAGMVETQSSGVGQVVDALRVQQLPLIGRQITDLITLAGGATLSSNNALNSSRNYGTAAISVAGGLGSGTAYMLDGAMHNDPYNNLTLPLPFPDAMQEFKVETSALPAQYGLHSAAAVNAVTKSGTNAFHGDAFEFVRNYLFNARNFFALQRDSLKRNQFGGTLGGPIRKNKLFFFGAYQGTITRQNGITNTMIIPTQAMVGGDFTAYASAACQASGKPLALPAPFVNNKISPALLSTPALNLVAKLPTTPDPCGRITFGVPNISQDKQAVGRADYQLKDNHSLFVRYNAANFVAPNPYSLVPSVLETGASNGTSFGQDILVQASTLGDTYVISPTMVNSFRMGVNRSGVARVGSSFFSGPDLGINMYSYFPKFISVTAGGVNGFTVGTNTSSDSSYHTTTFQLGNDLSWVKGNHQFAFGVSAARWQSETLAGVYSFGLFNFSTLQDFMLGNVTSLQQAQPNTLFMHQAYLGLYAQDSWKATPRLAFSYGLRWEPFFPQQLTDGHIYHIDLGAFTQGKHTSVFPNAPNGIFYPGDPGFPTYASINKRWGQFAPRVGVIWDPKGDGRMSIRASYGIFYDILPAETNLNTVVAGPWFTRLTVQGVNFANPWASQPGGNPFPSTSTSTFVPGATWVSFPTNMHPTMVQSRNLSIQRQFGKDWLISVSYLGSQITHLVSPQEMNPAEIVPGPIVTTGCAATATNCNSAANTNARRLFSLINPAQGKFYGVTSYADDGGTGTYNGLLLSVQKRLSRGFTAAANYTWSHCIGDYVVDSQLNAQQDYTHPFDRHADRGDCYSSATDRRQIVNVSAVVESPKFHDRWLGMFASGWRVSTIITGQSGAALNATLGNTDQALNGITAQRPNLISSSIYGGDLNNYLLPSAFATPALGTLGNLGAGVIRGPGFVTVNMSLSRTFRIREGQNLELRAEGSNILNTLNAGNPNLIQNTPTFGRITTTAAGTGSGFVAPGDPRILQFAIKYIF